MKKILIIEDDKNILQGLMIRIRNLGYAVVTAQDGYSGVAMAKKENPDLILMDIGLPGGDGLTIADRISNIGGLSSIPLIFLTANQDPALKKRALATGAVAFFRKPYQPEELADAIRDAIETPSSAV